MNGYLKNHSFTISKTTEWLHKPFDTLSFWPLRKEMMSKLWLLRFVITSIKSCFSDMFFFFYLHLQLKIRKTTNMKHRTEQNRTEQKKQIHSPHQSVISTCAENNFSKIAYFVRFAFVSVWRRFFFFFRFFHC